jgi:hypothetical protein
MATIDIAPDKVQQLVLRRFRRSFSRKAGEWKPGAGCVLVSQLG